ncbi:MAG TPA: trypsin-like peptidase domain-containing protein [Fimbriiglobus sp.]|jgi:serine protease Do
MPRTFLFVSLFGFAFVPGVRAIDPSPRVASAALPSRRDAMVNVVEKVQQAVVDIHSKRTMAGAADDPFRTFGGMQPQTVNGMGTGIVLDPRGYAVTNHHVVDGVQSLRVSLSDGSTVPAKILAVDKDADLALIKFDAPRPLPTVPLGTASDLFLAEEVLAIGNAYGYEHTVTLGFISAKNRDVTLNKDVAYKALIQTQTPINPGNSGGPLFNKFGELVGVNVAIRANSQNIAFAIPVDTMIGRAAELLSGRKQSGLRHGMVVQDHFVRDKTDSVLKRWAVVSAVEPNSSAAAAGVKPGDRIDQVGEIPCKTSLDVERGFVEKGAGTKVTVKLTRGTAERITVTLALQSPVSTPGTAAETVQRRFGIKVTAVSKAAVSAVNPELRGGLYIDDVTPGSPAAAAGLAKGDVLIGVHLWESLSPEHVLHVLNHKDYATFLPLKIYFVRGGKLRETSLTPDI